MLLALDSFDHYNTATLGTKGWSPTGAVAVMAGQGRNGTQSLRTYYTGGQGYYNYATRALPPVTGSTIIFGLAFRAATLLDNPIINVFEGSYGQVQITLTSSGALEVRRANGGNTGTSNYSNVLITTPALVTAGIYTYIELKVLIANTGGTAEIRVNGTTAGTFSGDTQANGATWSTVKLGRDHIDTTNNIFDYDDLYICDGSGSTHNDFLGDHRIVALVAQTGNGTHTDWVPSTGTNHGALVDETVPDNTDYVSATVVGATDTFNFPPVGVVGTVKAVQVCNYAKCDIAGLRVMTPGSRPPGGPFYPANGQLMSSEWQYAMEIFTTNPVTVAPWTVAEIDASEFGVTITV